MVYIPFQANAQGNYAVVETSVKQAINEKSFYHYNLAYAKIMELPEGYEKDKLLSELAHISKAIWTKEISEIVEKIETMAKEKSGRLYDLLEARIGKSDIQSIDKQYLLGEITGWGRDLIWTEDYKKAVAAIVEVWDKKTEAAADEAEKIIKVVQNKINKEYLMELLSEAKTILKLEMVTIDSKYFIDSSTPTYIGDGRSVNLDLSADTVKRTITLKGRYADLNINAPMADLILEDAEINNLNILDIPGASIYLRGSTMVQNLTVNDMDDNARIILQGTAAVLNTEVKSGAKIEVAGDSKASSPLGRFIINPGKKKTVELRGNFKETVIFLESPVQLEVWGVIDRINISKEAEHSVIDIFSGARVGEVNAEAALTVRGNGTLANIGGSAGSKVINNMNTNSGSGGSSAPQVHDVEKPVITLLGDKSVTLANGVDYVDAGAKASDNKDGDITNKIVKTIKNSAGTEISAIDTKLAGTYTITYSVSDKAGNSADPVIRTVTVLPVAQPKELKNVVIKANSTTGRVTVEGNTTLGSGKNVTFKLTDPSGEISNLNQVASGEDGKFVFDFSTANLADGIFTARIGGEGIDKPYKETFEIKNTAKPVITLSGESIITTTGSPIYVFEGVSAWDNKDGDITNKITATISNASGSAIQLIQNATGSGIQIIQNTTGSEIQIIQDTTTGSAIQITVPGKYIITYSVNNAAGNASNVCMRTLEVLAAREEDKIEPKQSR